MTYVVLVGFIIVQIMLYFMGRIAIKGFAQISRIPYYILLPMVLGFCLVGAYACSNNATDILVAIIFGIIGYIAPKFGFPSTPLLIGIVLGTLAEKNLVRTMAVYGSTGVFFTRPISLTFFILSVLSVGIAIYQNNFSAKKA
jgi:putative tricarboxylic transport membrane protein